jgi:methionyl-tRNA synthetase
MKFYITTPIYYINDKPHIGSAYPTVAADVIARYRRLISDDVWFLTGTAEHGGKIVAAAEKAGESLPEFCDRIAQSFTTAWEKLNISHDDFLRTTEDRHKHAVDAYFLKLKDSGKLYEKDYEGLYCVGCESFKHEKDLIDGVCPDHQKAPEIVRERNWFFKLSEYGQVLEEAITSGALAVEPESRRNEVLSFIRQGLEDVTVSRRTGKWAFPLPWDADQTIYVWLDELFNYCSAIGYGENRENFEKWWPADVHVIGKDIVKFHAVIWPALLLAIGEQMPKKVFAHGFFTIDGQKMSKSLGNTIDPIELVDTYGADAARYLLLSQFPFGGDGDIKAASFNTSYNSDLANGIGNFVSRVISMVSKYSDSKVPKSSTQLQAQTTELWRRYHDAFARYALDEVIKVVREMTTLGDSYIEKNQPWVLVKTDLVATQEVLYNLLEIVRQLAVMIQPILPDTSAKIFASLNVPLIVAKSESDLGVWGILVEGSPVEPVSLLFPRVDSSQ